MTDATERIAELRSEAEAALARAPDTAALEELRVKYLGRKAELTTILRGISDLPAEERGPVGKSGNEARVSLEELIASRESDLDAAEIVGALAGDAVDVTLPGAPARLPGHLHLVTRTRR